MYSFLRILFFFDKFIMFWGPGIHLHIGNKLLNDTELEPKKKEIICNNKKEFLYGTIAPDITLGKKYIKDLEKHSHIWKTGFNVVKKARTDKELALGYGYLTHLAADVIAHNYYLPKELLLANGLRNFRHTILEMKVDMILYHDTYELIENVLKENYKKEDEYLKKIISKATLPFGINKKIFEYSLKTVKSEYINRTLKRLTKYEEWELKNKKLIKKYHDYSYELAKNVLNEMENSKVANYDPNGKIHLDHSKKQRKTLGKVDLEKMGHRFYIFPNELNDIGG